MSNLIRNFLFLVLQIAASIIVCFNHAAKLFCVVCCHSSKIFAANPTGYLHSTLMLNSMIMTGEPNQVKRPSVYGMDASFQSTRMKQTDYSPYMPGPSTHTNNYLFYSNFGRMPSAVSFPLPTEPSYNTDNFLNGSMQFRCKRKLEDSPSSISVKQHITEDRMAEHLAKLHISTQNPLPSSEPESSEVTEKRLYMCEEMRKLQTESVIPQSLLDRVTGPCKALVLWSPPQRIFPIPPSVIEEENYDNNNEEAVPDNNLMDLDR